MAESSYQGWSGGYCTWACNLWVGNDEGPYHESQELARSAHGDAWKLADSLKDWMRESMPEPAGLAGDLLTYAFGLIDWHEIAESMLKDQAEGDGDDSDDDTSVESMGTFLPL